MCDKAINTHYSTIHFVPECYIRLKKFVMKLSIFSCVYFLTQEMCDRDISEDPSLIVYCPNKYITRKICDEAVDDFLTTLKLIPHWFVTYKMIEKILCTQMKIHSILMKILMSYFLALKWSFSI